MTTNRRDFLGLVPILLATACDYNFNEAPDNPIAPSATPATGGHVEFRVNGVNLDSVIVRVNNGLDGLTQISTVLPYTHTITLTGRGPVFLSLDARAFGSGFLHAAIFVDGVIFREASSSQFNPIVAVNGTYRR